MNIRYNPERPEIAKQLGGRSQTFMSFAMPMQSAKSKKDALRFAFDAMEMGADSIICGTWSLDLIETVAKAGIPAEGHLGLVPRKSTWTGGLRAVGKPLNKRKTFDDLKLSKMWVHGLGN